MMQKAPARHLCSAQSSPQLGFRSGTFASHLLFRPGTGRQSPPWTARLWWLVHQALVQSIWCKATWWFLRRSLVLGSSGWWPHCCQKQRLSQNLFHGCSLGTPGILKQSSICEHEFNSIQLPWEARNPKTFAVINVKISQTQMNEICKFKHEYNSMKCLCVWQISA